MGFFNVQIHGRNFLIDLDGKREKYGFYVVVYVEASGEEEAETKAVGKSKSDEKLLSITKNSKSDSPMLYAEEFLAFKKKPEEHMKTLGRTGFAWYKEEPDISAS